MAILSGFFPHFSEIFAYYFGFLPYIITQCILWVSRNFSQFPLTEIPETFRGNISLIWYTGIFLYMICREQQKFLPK